MLNKPNEPNASKALLSKEASTSMNTKASLAQRSAVNDFFLTREGCFCLFSCFELHPKKKKKKNLARIRERQT
jgi:hypothetical protein